METKLNLIARIEKYDLRSYVEEFIELIDQSDFVKEYEGDMGDVCEIAFGNLYLAAPLLWSGASIIYVADREEYDVVTHLEPEQFLQRLREALDIDL